MAVPYTRISLQGTLPGGEVWSVNPAFIGNFDTTPPTTAELQTWANTIASSMSDIVSGPLRTALSARAPITNVRATLYGEDGRIRLYQDAPVTGFAGINQMALPPTTAVALSLYSALSGRSNRGRLFWPALGLGVDEQTGRLPLATCQGLANAAVEMLSDIQDAAPATWETVLGVWSPTLERGIAVTQVKVGDVLDSQRRRKDALDEARAIAAFPA